MVSTCGGAADFCRVFDELPHLPEALRPLFFDARLIAKLADGTKDELNKEIKAATVALNWPPQLSFIPHSFRHGFDQAMAEMHAAGEINDEELDDATKQTKGRKRQKDQECSPKELQQKQ